MRQKISSSFLSGSGGRIEGAANTKTGAAANRQMIKSPSALIKDQQNVLGLFVWFTKCLQYAQINAIEQVGGWLG